MSLQSCTGCHWRRVAAPELSRVRAMERACALAYDCQGQECEWFWQVPPHGGRRCCCLSHYLHEFMLTQGLHNVAAIVQRLLQHIHGLQCAQCPRARCLLATQSMTTIGSLTRGAGTQVHAHMHAVLQLLWRSQSCTWCSCSRCGGGWGSSNNSSRSCCCCTCCCCCYRVATSGSTPLSCQLQGYNCSTCCNKRCSR